MWIPTVNQAWAVLGIAIVLEVAGNTLVIRTLGLSVVYAVWSGVGTVLTAAIGFLYFREPATAVKLASIGLIVVGVLGLHTSMRAPA